jgi:hypothetical protein
VREQDIKRLRQIIENKIAFYEEKFPGDIDVIRELKDVLWHLNLLKDHSDFMTENTKEIA